MHDPPPPEVLRGIAFIILSASVFALVDGLSKLLADTLSIWQIVWARYVFALPVLVLLTPRGDLRALFRTANLPHQIGRGIVPIGVSVAMVLSVRYLPLAEATVILFSAPFLVVGLAGPLLGERVRAASWFGVAAGFAAVLIVARPGLGGVSYYALLPFAGAVLYATYQIVTRHLARKGERPATTLAWTLATGSVVATPLAALTWVPVSTGAFLIMVSLGLVFGAAQLLMVQAFAHAPAAELAPFSYAQLPAATVVGLVLFDAVPDGWTLFGIAVMIGAGVFLARTQRR